MAKHAISQVFQQIFTTQKFIASCFKMFKHRFNTFVFLLLICPAVKTKVKIGCTTAKVKYRISHTFFCWFNIVCRHGSGNIGSRFRCSLFHIEFFHNFAVVCQAFRQAAKQTTTERSQDFFFHFFRISNRESQIIG